MRVMLVAGSRVIATVAAMLICVSGSFMALAAEAEKAGIEPAKSEPINGTNLSRVTLTERAAHRLDIKTAKLAQEPNGKRSVPYSALFYETDGGVWVYEAEGPLSFVRHQVVVDAIEGDQAVLTNGPPVGAQVVTVGVPELYGIEKGVGE
jgi:hypothetical protein